MSKPPKDRDELARDERARERTVDSRWLHGEGREATSNAASGLRSATAPRVVVCDEGELDDVVRQLSRLDQSVLRVRPAQTQDLLEWERPSRLFITTVRIGLSHPLPVAQSEDGPVSIAIADNDAQTLCAAMLRRGFRYVVRRPVHPEALRLLLMQVLFTGREHRAVTRVPFGADVRWRSGFRTGSCTMTEVSAHGCRLLTNERFSSGSRLTLRVPSALTDSRGFRLRGRVVRRDLEDHGDGPRAHVALQFERLSARARSHLDALLAEHASGPAAMRERRIGEGTVRRERRGRSRFATLTVEPELPPLRSPDDSAVPEIDRRRRLRGEWHHEVVALDEQTEAVQHVLLGTDLSTGGLRVEPHPVLRIGDRLMLALYDADQPEPLIVRARIAHEDGRQGWGLIFEDLSEQAAERLDAMVSVLPPVSALSRDEDKPQGVVLGRIVDVCEGE